MKSKDRKTALFNAIISEHIKTASPVGSKFLVEKCGLNCSPATVRNHMAELEKQGLIHSPHTSAGRIPTAKGYKYYIENFLNRDKDLKAQYQKQIDSAAKEKDSENKLKSIAKQIAEISNQAVFLSLAENSFYYTGISNIFKKPEFQDVNIMHNLSEIIDQFDEVMTDINDMAEDQVNILIGQDNPFSENCSSILSYYKSDSIKGVIGVLGPMRMDYQQNYSLIKYVNKLFN